MAWVGLFFYSLHVPAILSAMAAGSRLLVLNAAMEAAAGEEAADEERIDMATSHQTATDTPLQEPLLHPHAGSLDHPSCPVRISIETQYSQDISLPRVSLPGHWPGTFDAMGSKSGSQASHGTTLTPSFAGSPMVGSLRGVNTLNHI
jgi:hypothetical protein